MSGDPIQIGPFVGGLNTFSDPTAVADNEAVQLENFELDLDGSLVSRPPLVDRGVSMPLGATGNFTELGYFFAAGGVAYLLASDGLNSTYYFNGSSWTLVTNTISATAMAQFDSKAWLVAPIGSANPSGYWTPGGGFVADANMPKGDSIVVQKFRLWIALGRDAVTNGTRLYFSKSLGTVPLWPVAPDFIDVGAGDGQNIVALLVYYQSLIIFRTDSIYSFTYTSDPAAGTASLMVNGVGLADKMALAPFEGYVYFMYDDKAYEFTNNRAAQINLKVPFQAITRTGIYRPYAVSVFNNRVIYSYYDVMFVFSLKTRTWTRWVSSVWGAIGNFVTDPASTVVPQGILHSSKAVSTAVVVRTNLCNNPELTTNTTSWVSGTAVVRVSSGGKFWATAANGTFTYAGATGIVGRFYSMSMRVRGPVGAQFTIASTDNVVGDVIQSGPVEVIPASGEIVVTRSSSRAVSGTGLNYGVGSVAGGPVFITESHLEEVSGIGVPMAGLYFSGATVDTADWDYAWVGTAGNSASTATSKRNTKTLFITDGTTSEREAMHCILQTKNYNYDSAGAYKKLDYWGVDASYRGQVTAIVTPIAYNYQVTWGQLLGFTWGQLKLFTWGQPISGTLAVETVRNTAGSGAMRKFTKFLKRLRFRQITFKLDFVTDGSIDSAPVRVFSLLTYVRSKQRVSKTIT